MKLLLLVSCIKIVCKILLIPETDSRHQAIPILNPISEEFPVMRTTLVPSVLETAKRNVSSKEFRFSRF